MGNMSGKVDQNWSKNCSDGVLSFPFKVLEQKSDMIKMVLWEGAYGHGVEASLNEERRLFCY